MTFDCNETQDRLSAWLDEELDAAAVEQLEAHLAECAVCRQEADGLRREHDRLTAAFAPRQTAADKVADAVIAALPSASVETVGEIAAKQVSTGGNTSSGALDMRRMLHLLLAAAAGFLLAVLLLRPWEQKPSEPGVVDNPRGVAEDDEDAAIRPVMADEADVARLSLATGPIEYSPAEGAEFFSCPTNTALCSGAVLRTPTSAVCELRCEESVRVRLNETSEVRLAGKRRFELNRGRLWLDVQSATEPCTIAAAGLTMTCDEATLECRVSPPDVTLLVLRGSAAVAGPDWQESVAAGQQFTFAGGQRMLQSSPVDPIVETRWVHDLLVLEGGSDEELNQRIDRLWAQVGRAKMTHLYEAEIRSLGGHCVTPLTCYVQSPESRGEGDRRIAAARLLADVAQAESIPELISLLSDEDGEVRRCAAEALERLTGQNFGRPPDDWSSSPWTACQPTTAQWQSWWQTAKHRYPGARQDATAPTMPLRKKG